jgi:hypothetical protein
MIMIFGSYGKDDDDDPVGAAQEEGEEEEEEDRQTDMATRTRVAECSTVIFVTAITF